jgi:hypothetical protein
VTPREAARQYVELDIEKCEVRIKVGNESVTLRPEVTSRISGIRHQYVKALWADTFWLVEQIIARDREAEKR